MLYCFREVKCQQDSLEKFDIKHIFQLDRDEHTLMVQWLANQSSIPAVRDRFPGVQNMNLLFHSDIVSLLSKTNGGRGRKPGVVIFVDWRALIVVRWGGWWHEADGLVQGWLKTHFVSLALFKQIASARSQSLRGASHQPAFMSSYLTKSHTYLPSLPIRQIRKLPCVTQGVVSLTPDQRMGLCSLVCKEGIWMAKLMVV